MKQYPLDIQELREFNGGHMGWYSKGHHEVRLFLSDVASIMYLNASESGRLTDEMLRYVRHEWWRCVPVPGQKVGTLSIMSTPNTYGAFPVTVVEGI